MVTNNSYIGNYQVVSELASGALGRVYLAQHTFLRNRIVAVKLMHAVHLSSSEECGRFIREAQFLEVLKHPHILPIIDVGMHEGFPYLVAEYAPNGSLRNRLERWSHRLLPLGEAITIIYQVGQALQYAHQQNIVHRDLKPENILFNAKGEVLLADFGLATILTTSSVKPSTITGTVAYMSPEQLQGSISKESDQYALGCIAYELFTGRIPFNATDLTTLIVKHLTENPISPRQLNPGLPEHIEKAILKAMAKDRSMRHPDISAFLVALSKPSQGLSQEDRNAWAQTILGITLLFPGDKEKIIAISEQATRLDPDFEFPYFTRGVALNDLGRYAEALEDFERSIKLDPHNAHSWFYKGDILQQFGRREEAQQAYNRAQALVDSNDDKELDHLFDFENNHDAVETMEQPFQFDSDAARVYYTKGLALERAQRYREALLAYERAIDLHPKYVAAWRSRGMVLLLLKCYKESVNAYEQALRLDPTSEEAYSNKGVALFHLHRYEEALAAYEQALRLNPNVAEVHNNKGNVLSLLNRPEKALAAYAIAIRLNPNFALAHHNTGHIYLRLKHYQKALASFEWAIQLNPNSADTYNGIGAVLSEMRHSKEALLAFEKAIACDCNNADAWRNKGKTLSELGRYRESLDAFEKAIRLAPRFKSAYNDKGNALSQLGRYQEAFATFARAIELDPNYADGHNGKGNALAGLNRFNDAIMAYMEAIRLEPNEALFHTNLGNVLRQVGRVEEAQQAYSRARQLREGLIW